MRTGFGELELGNLKIGKYRFLTGDEVSALKHEVGLK
jgi:16S rRNA U516 pseudouridylate synthase RsuA-like enzyme